MIIYILACTMGVISTGCAFNGPPKPVHQEMVIDKHIQPMSRNEVIVAVMECETNGLRGVMLYGKRKVNGFTADIVLDVTCAPKR